MTEMLLLCTLAAIGVVAGIGLSVLAERRRQRRLWSRYAQSGREPASIVCPDCNRRSYGERAVREKYCHACKTHHDDPTRHQPMLRIVA